MTLVGKTLAELALLNSAVNPVPVALYPLPNTLPTGTITTIPVAQLVDGETFTLDDGVNTASVFEFDVAGDGVTGGNVAVDVSSITTADEVRDAIISAINGLDPSIFLIDAADGGAATVDLENPRVGNSGNTTSSDTVVDAGFVVTNMAGGVDYPTQFPDANGEGVDVSGVSRCVVGVMPTGADATFSVVARTEDRTDAFEALNNLEGITATDGIGWKEIVNVAPEDEVTIYVTAGPPIEDLGAFAAPCTG